MSRSMAPPSETPTLEALLHEWEIFTTAPAAAKDVAPLRKAAIEHLKLGPKLPIAQIAPTLAVMWFSAIDWEPSRLRDVLSIRATVWFLKIVYPRRPMWNDFYVALWELSRDPFYVRVLHEHIAKARARRNVAQFETAIWMVGSVCRQDPEFATEWEHATQDQGDVFAGVLP